MSANEGQSYQGPDQIDPSPGVYPATAEFENGSVLAICYKESDDSTVRALHF